MVQGITISQLIERGFLVRPRVFGFSNVVNLQGIEKGANGDYNSKQLAARMNIRGITGDAIEHYQRICPGVPAVACVTWQL